MGDSSLDAFLDGLRYDIVHGYGIPDGAHDAYHRFGHAPFEVCRMQPLGRKVRLQRMVVRI